MERKHDIKTRRDKVTKILVSGALMVSLSANAVTAFIDACHRNKGAEYIAEKIEESGVIPENFGVNPTLGATKIIYLVEQNINGSLVHRDLSDEEAKKLLNLIMNELVEKGFTKEEFISYMDYKYDYAFSAEGVNFLDVWEMERSTYWANKYDEIKGRH